MEANLTKEYYMRQALIEANLAIKRKEIPVGAVVVHNHIILSRAHNATISLKDPTAHAEILAIREACRIQQNYRIPECDVYVTLEPCPMCLGSLVQARIRRLIFGALDPKWGAVESIMAFPFEAMNHSVQVTGGILYEECGTILKDFFSNKR